jgi:preprotein translocase subunit SecG
MGEILYGESLPLDKTVVVAFVAFVIVALIAKQINKMRGEKNVDSRKKTNADAADKNKTDKDK